MKTQLTIAAAVGRDARKLRLRRGLLVRHDGRGRTLVGTLRRHDARRAGRTGVGEQPRRGRSGRARPAGPGQPQDRKGAIPAADRRGSHRRGRIYARDEDRAVVCRRTDPLVGTVAVRGAAQRQTGRKGRNRGLGVGFGGRQALAGRRGRHDLLHAAGV